MKSTNLQYISRLDHLRFVAAIMVLLWHVMRWENNVSSAEVPAFWPLSFLSEGHTGVALFMTLSGYVFQHLCRNGVIDFIPFIRNRFLRIAPLFFVWTLYYFYTGTIDASQLFVAIAALLNRQIVPGVGWTVIVEFQFYLLFPFLLIFQKRYGITYFFALVFLLIFFRFLTWIASGTVQDLAYSTIFGRLDQFLLGMLACELSIRHPSRFRSALLLAGLVFTWCFLYHRFDKLGGYFDYGSYPSKAVAWVYLPALEGIFYGLITATYLATINFLPKFADKALAWLGMLSYSLYLNHPMAIQVAGKLYKFAGLDSSGFWPSIFFAFAAVFPILLAMSIATYYLIERPFLALRRPYIKETFNKNI